RLGSVLERRWRLDAELGRGGAGTVFRAFDLTGQRGAAVKVLLPSLARNPVAVARFEREARILSTVSHPNLVALYAVGRSGALPYIAMELLMGQPLSARLKDESVRLSTAEVLRIVDAVASALEALHSRGLVHRDVKPANVFLGPGGRVTLLDLGAVFERADPGLTRPNHWIGTPAYMAPEQLLSGAVDARTDVYALAALTFELLVGFPPFKASDPDALSLAQRSLPPPDASQLSPAVSRVAGRVLMAALARNPQDRFPTPGTFAAALREGLTGLSSTQDEEQSSESTEVGPPRSDVPTPRITREDLPWRKR
ncbi:MAG TPA: serine/threonine-protein kinase, partial [Myxococcales bacterium]|nr:serine/threonine-protein kinase [Myxococcales bacterium]